jgi:probable rRNA maturation factor
MTTKIIINLTNKTTSRINQKSLAEAAQELMFKKKLFGIFEIDLSIIDPKEIKKLNYQYLGRDYVTNVLSFPIFSKSRLITTTRKDIKTPFLLGGIVIAYDIAKKEAMEKNISVDEQVKFLFLHSIKHLLGYHHK